MLTPFSSAVELPWQDRPMMPPATAASAALPRNGVSAAWFCVQATLSLPNVAEKRFFSLV